MKTTQQLITKLEPAIEARRKDFEFADQFDMYLDDALANAKKFPDSDAARDLLIISARNAGYGEIVGY